MLQSLNNFAIRMSAHYPNMNRGGCAVFAVHVAKRLQSIVPVKIKVCNYDYLDLDEIRAQLDNPLNINRWYSRNVDFVHLVVEFEYQGQLYHYDTDGVRLAEEFWEGDKDFPFATGSFTIEEVTSFTASRFSWNTTFDRKHIPSIKRKVQNLFSRHLYHDVMYKYQLKPTQQQSQI